MGEREVTVYFVRHGKKSEQAGEHSIVNSTEALSVITSLPDLPVTELCFSKNTGLLWVTLTKGGGFNLWTETNIAREVTQPADIAQVLSDFFEGNINKVNRRLAKLAIQYRPILVRTALPETKSLIYQLLSYIIPVAVGLGLFYICD